MSTHKKFLAVHNFTGYLPTDGEKLFTNPLNAWLYLSEVRQSQEDDAALGDHAPNCPWNDATDYSDTLSELWDFAGYRDRAGRVEGDTPGYCGKHDRGYAYSVREVI